MSSHENQVNTCQRGSRLAVVGGSAVGASASSAHVRPVPTARGSVALSGPIQYVSFAASARPGHHGWSDYTNFHVPGRRHERVEYRRDARAGLRRHLHTLDDGHHGHAAVDARDPVLRDGHLQ